MGNSLAEIFTEMGFVVIDGPEEVYEKLEDEKGGFVLPGMMKEGKAITPEDAGYAELRDESLARCKANNDTFLATYKPDGSVGHNGALRLTILPQANDGSSLSITWGANCSRNDKEGWILSEKSGGYENDPETAIEIFGHLMGVIDLGLMNVDNKNVPVFLDWRRTEKAKKFVEKLGKKGLIKNPRDPELPPGWDLLAS